jgi:hypothetical protein
MKGRVGLKAPFFTVVGTQQPGGNGGNAIMLDRGRLEGGSLDQVLQAGRQS